MKSVLLTFVMVAGLSSSVFAAENKAIKINVFGGIAGFDKEGYQAIRSNLGFLLAKGSISQFKTLSMGSEGGGSFCVEAAGKNDALTLSAALKPIQLEAKTVFELSEVENCSAQ
ncbi:MAG: hypothetical protein KA715_12990 [Xanthomonadaceae bacterium]|nr:hypothetical protein [Xanthomonadaceae bacterium]